MCGDGAGMNILILGGTAEARRLAAALSGDARYDATISLAGRTREPAAQSLPTRIGGFGGVDGLIAYLRAKKIEALIDATHPFAARMSANARAAAAITGTRLLALHRPPWTERPGDQWTHVPDMTAAVAALGSVPEAVFVTIGRQDVAPLKAAPWHRYVLRSVEPPEPGDLPPFVEIMTARGPFALADELRLMRDRSIDMLVTKNAGGAATAAKLDAARTLGIPVVMIARPPGPSGPEVTVEDALNWLHAATERGA